jgi:Tfp pilus assembly protein PilF
MGRRCFFAGIALVVLCSACGSSSPRGTDPAAAAVTLEKGVTDLRAGHTALATREFRTATKLDPDNKYAWFDLGVTTSNAGHVSAADRDYQSAIAIDPMFEPALFNYGYDQYGSKRYAAASSYLRRAAAAIPNDAGAHLYLGLSLAMQADSNAALGKEATAELQLALKLNPAFRKDLQTTILGVVPIPTGSATSTTTQRATPP